MKVTYLQSYELPSRAGIILPFKALEIGDYAVLNRRGYRYVYYISRDGYEYEYSIKSDTWHKGSQQPHSTSKDNSEMIILSEDYVQSKYSLCPWR